jgi:hypothetical protein
MARKAAKPQHVEPEDESQETPKAGFETHGRTANGKPMTKADACRAALAEGIETTEEAVSFARSRFGIDIKPTDFTLYKSKAKKQDGGKAKAKPGRKPKAAVEGYLAPAPKQIEPTGEGDLIDVLEKMKPLIAQYGAEKVKRLVDLLG